MSTDRPHPPSVERLLVDRRGVEPAASVTPAASPADVRPTSGRGWRPAATRRGPWTSWRRGRRQDRFVGAEAGPLPVINATGVILHTNLGRAPWPTARPSAAALAAGYLAARARPRDWPARPAVPRTAEEHLIALTGAEDALVTNNNAAALALAVGLAGRRRRRRLARRARRDRRRRPDPRDHPARRRAADRGRDDEPDARRGLRGAARRRSGDGRPPRPSLELRHDRLHRGARPRRARRARPSPRRDRHRRPRLRRAARHDRLRARPRADARRDGWRPARTSSRSAATSSWAGRRPG